MIMTTEMISLSRLNEGNQTRLLGLMAKAKQKNDITVAFIGGSITQCFSAGPQACYARLATDWFCASFPDINVTYINAGVGATGSYFGVHRVGHDVLRFGPDLVFVEFSVNDTAEETERNREAYGSLLHKIWHHESRPAVITVAMTMEDGRSFQDEHLKAARHYDVPMISYRNAVFAAAESGAFRWADISDDDIHPNENGHRLLAGLIIAYLEDVKKHPPGCQADDPLSDAAFASGKYVKAVLLRPDSTIPPGGADDAGDSDDSGGGFSCPCRCGLDAVFGKLLSSGGFMTSGENFGNVAGYWRLAKRMTFAVKCRNIGIFYAKLTDKGGDFTVFVDGVKIKDVNTDFSGGWGDYVEGEEFFTAPEMAEHIIEVLANPENTAGNKEILITAIALS